jgi:23S rRNA (guanosine2251-2'-O)-methyltransferase
VRAVGQLRQGGYWAVALDARADVSIFQLDLPSPTVLVIGGETGVRPLLSRSCDLSASIPMPGAVESLNVSVASAVALYEVYRRRPGGGGRLP